MMATGILEVELIERIYDLWEQKACHKCGNDVKKRYEDTPPINTKNKKKFKHKDQNKDINDHEIVVKDAPGERPMDTILSSSNQTFPTN